MSVVLGSSVVSIYVVVVVDTRVAVVSSAVLVVVEVMLVSVATVKVSRGKA